MITETPARAQGFGAQQLLVTPTARLTLEQYRGIYRDTAEIPQRVSKIEGFPLPGRRGPSRVAAAQPGAVPPGETAPGAGAGEVPTPGEPSVYPPPRDPRDADQIVTNSSIPPAGSPLATVGANCTGPGGAHLQIGINLANGASQVNVSERIDRPFKITHVEHFSDGTPAAKTQFRLKIASDNSTTGGLAATGTNLDELNLGGDDFLGEGQLHRSFPNKVWRQLPAFIKFCHDNQTGAQRAFQTVVNIEYLD